MKELNYTCCLCFLLFCLFVWFCHLPRRAFCSVQTFLYAWHQGSPLWECWLGPLVLIGGVLCAQPLSCVWLFVTPWTAARQASLRSCACYLMSSTNRSLLCIMSHNRLNSLLSMRNIVTIVFILICMYFWKKT